MKAIAFDAGSGAGLLLAAVAAYVVWAALRGVQLPMVSGPKAAFWAVTAIGVTACAVGGIGSGLVRAGQNWLDPFILAGVVLGVLALVVVGAFAAGVHLPMIADERAALIAIAGLVAAKFVVSTAHGMFATLVR
jgi:hypothetical protein